MNFWTIPHSIFFFKFNSNMLLQRNTVVRCAFQIENCNIGDISIYSCWFFSLFLSLSMLYWFRHRIATAVYQVTRPGHEHCDATEGILLDITPLLVDNKKLVTLYDKDLTEGVNLLIGTYFECMLFGKSQFFCICFFPPKLYVLVQPQS